MLIFLESEAVLALMPAGWTFVVLLVLGCLTVLVPAAVYLRVAELGHKERMAEITPNTRSVDDSTGHTDVGNPESGHSPRHGPPPPPKEWTGVAGFGPVGLAWAAMLTSALNSNRDVGVTAWVAVAIVGTAVVVCAATVFRRPPRREHPAEKSGN